MTTTKQVIDYLSTFPDNTLVKVIVAEEFVSSWTSYTGVSTVDFIIPEIAMKDIRYCQEHETVDFDDIEYTLDDNPPYDIVGAKVGTIILGRHVE